MTTASDYAPKRTFGRTTPGAEFLPPLPRTVEAVPAISNDADTIREAEQNIRLLSNQLKNPIDRIDIQFNGATIVVEASVGTQYQAKRLIGALTALVTFLPEPEPEKTERPAI